MSIDTTAYDQHIASGGSPRTAPGFVYVSFLSGAIIQAATDYEARRVRASLTWQCLVCGLCHAPGPRPGDNVACANCGTVHALADDASLRTDTTRANYHANAIRDRLPTRRYARGPSASLPRAG